MFRFHFLLLCSFIYISSQAAESTAARDAYIQKWKDEAIYQMVVNKIPASITLAQGILESGDGNSRLAREGNNHFGIKCHNDWTGKRIYEDDETKGECFRQYKSANESYEDHSLFLKRKRYESLFLLDTDDYKGWAKGLKQCGYATNPKYPQLLIGIIEEFHLDEFDKVGMEYIRKKQIPGRSVDSGTPPAVIAKNGKSKDIQKRQKRTKQEEDRTTITIRHERELLVSDNNIKYILAKAGDTPESIANDFDLHELFIRKYNDLISGEKIKTGEKIYIQPKRNRASESSCIVKAGESLRDISQRYGVKLKKLRRYNDLSEGAQLATGTTVRLKP
jgi:LysM repeat protein